MASEIILKPLAEMDINEAAEWYYNRSEKLTKAFFNSVESAMLSISKFPEIYQKRYKNVRVVFISRFPYGIYYTIEEGRIVIHAVLHTKRQARIALSRL